MDGAELLSSCLPIFKRLSGGRFSEMSLVVLVITLQQHHLDHQWYSLNVGVFQRRVFNAYNLKWKVITGSDLKLFKTANGYALGCGQGIEGCNHSTQVDASVITQCQTGWNTAEGPNSFDPRVNWRGKISSKILTV